MKNTKINITVDIMTFIIFLMLKLDGIIDWKWIWVFSPFWMTWIIEIAICLIVWVTSWKPKSKPYVGSGPSLVWDAKTNTLYGPWSAEENENAD